MKVIYSIRSEVSGCSSRTIRISKPRVCTTWSTRVALYMVIRNREKKNARLGSASGHM
jgi:hypothetical protein